VDALISQVARHGYGLLFAAVLLESVGFPIPAALALMMAGGAIAHGSFHGPGTVVGAVSALMLGDTLMFFMGRFTGWWLLGLLCRLSLNPESCILRSADSFYRRGRLLLVFAKFVPGINTMAPPLAGSMNMRPRQFFALDLAGATLYVVFYITAGFLFSDALDAVTRLYRAFSGILSWTLATIVVAYVVFRASVWITSRPSREIRFATPLEVAHASAAGDVAIYDVRSHGYYDPRATRIQGSVRLEPNALHQLAEALPTDKPIYLYCSCVREATSARVAQVLLDRGLQTAVIKGGLRAWKKAGLPMEAVPPDQVAPLPLFGST
jgi:membrane protein DedA with SNARE-associated domain/rhodanese-related sulfurtransferase